MSKASIAIGTKLLVVSTLVLFMVAQHPRVLSSQEAIKTTTAVKHKPLKHFVAGHRVQVEAKVTDPQGVLLVRCYFRAAEQEDYVFVGMEAGEKDMFTGILPAPAGETKSIQYLFLAVNGKNQVVKTQTFRTGKKNAKDIPSWQQVGTKGHVALSSELTQASAPVGFADSITVDLVESSVRFGFVAGLYDTLQVTSAGGTTGTAAGGASTGAPAGATGVAIASTATGAAVAAVSAGTVSASAGVSTAVLVGTGAAMVAVGAGVAVAAGGDSEGVSDDGGTGSASQPSGCARYTGNWAGTGGGTNCLGVSFSRPLTMTTADDCSATVCNPLGCRGTQVVGDTVTLSVPTADCGQYTWTGTFTSATTFSGSWQYDSGSGGGTFSFTKQ